MCPISLLILAGAVATLVVASFAYGTIRKDPFMRVHL